MTILRHECLSKTSRPSLFVPTEQEHLARCVCGYETLPTTSLHRASSRMAEHVFALRDHTFVSDLSPAGVAVQRRLDAFALDVASEAMREEARVARVNADLRSERLYSRQEHIIWFAIGFLIVALFGAAMYFEHKAEQHAAELSR